MRSKFGMVGMVIIGIASMATSATATYCSASSWCFPWTSVTAPIYITGGVCGASASNVTGSVYGRLYGGTGMAMRTTTKCAFQVRILNAVTNDVRADSGLYPFTFSCDYNSCGNYWDHTLMLTTTGAACPCVEDNNYKTKGSIYSGYIVGQDDTRPASYTGGESVLSNATSAP